MEIRVLTDNNTLIDRYFLGEPALSLYIETGTLRILFDTGYSDVFLRNAAAMGVDLSRLTHVVLSHGHNDHTNGLPLLWERTGLRDAALVAHPGCFRPKRADGLNVGAPCTEAEAAAHLRYLPSSEPRWLSEECVFLGAVPRKTTFENRTPFGRELTPEGWREDYVEEDSALAFRTEKGLFLVTGCSHSGVCNMADYARTVCGETRIAGILGGFHLLRDDAQLAQTVRWLADAGVGRLYPCHCVCLAAKARLMAALPVEELGVSSTLTL